MSGSCEKFWWLYGVASRHHLHHRKEAGLNPEPEKDQLRPGQVRQHWRGQGPGQDKPLAQKPKKVDDAVFMDAEESSGVTFIKPAPTPFVDVNAKASTTVPKPPARFFNDPQGSWDSTGCSTRRYTPQRSSARSNSTISSHPSMSTPLLYSC